MNYKATCIYDDMTVVIENDVEVSRIYQDNRTEYTKECFKHGGIYPLELLRKAQEK